MHNLCIYFLAGVLQDFLLTLNWRFIVKERTMLAAFFSFVVTVVSMFVLYSILTQIDNQDSAIAIIVYALGVGTGTVIGMKTKISKGRKE